MMDHRKEKNERIEEEVFKTLRSLDDTQKVKASPFFYTRLKPKIMQFHKKETRRLSYPGFLQPVFLVLLVAAGVFSGIYLGQGAAIDQREENIEMMITTYGLDISDDDYLFAE